MRNFWDFNNYFSPPIPKQHQISLGESSTSVYRLKDMVSNRKNGRFLDDNVWIKDESRNPTGTHKDRAFAYWISYWRERGARELAIASSGNSAVSAAAYCEKAGIRLRVFASERIAGEKLKNIQNHSCAVIHQSRLPRRDSIQFSQKRNVPNLLASKHDEGIEGYKTLAFEIKEQVPDAKHLFIPTSSGATITGIYRGFEALNTDFPAIYAVQTAFTHPIAETFDKDFHEESSSRAKAIVDRVAPRRERVLEILSKTNGGGYVISNKELANTMSYFDGAESVPGWQSALAFAGFLKWRKEKAQSAMRTGPVVLVFTD